MRITYAIRYVSDMDRAVAFYRDKLGLEVEVNAAPAFAMIRIGAGTIGLLSVAEAGATAVIQPGGSVRDAEVIAAADKAGLAMMFTGVRHFRH